MSSIIVTTLILLVTYTAAYTLHQEEKQNVLNDVADNICCMPKKWQGFVSLQQSLNIKHREPKLNVFVFDYAADSSNKQIAMAVIKADGPKYDYVARIIQDFKKQKQYVIVESKKYCNGTSLKKQWKDQCVPSSAIDLGSSYLGASDMTASLPVHSYGFTENNVYSTMAITKDCIPVGLTTILDTEYVKMFSSIGYINVTAHIREMALFDVPDYCLSDYLGDITQDMKELFEKIDVFTQFF